MVVDFFSGSDKTRNVSKNIGFRCCLLIFVCISEEPPATNAWVKFWVINFFKLLHWKGFYSTIFLELMKNLPIIHFFKVMYSILTLQVPLTLPSLVSKTDSIFLKEDTQKCVFNKTYPRAFISQYNPMGVYWPVKALGHVLCNKHSRISGECTEHLVLAHSAIHRQAQAKASVMMHSVKAHWMPYHTVTLQNLYKSIYHTYMNYSGEHFVSSSFSAQFTLKTDL